MVWKKYKKEEGYSYTLGAFPTMELILHAPEKIMDILISSDFREKEKVIGLLEEKKIPYRIADKEIRRLAVKGNTYLVGVFKTVHEGVRDKNHVVLDRVSDMGNLGNISRSLLAFGLHDLVTLGDSCDFDHPRTVRSSMGAVFHLRYSHYHNLEEYRRAFPDPNRKLFLFMLDPQASPLPGQAPPEKWSLVFGNEGAGLDPEAKRYGRPVFIPQSEEVDSLNLTTACAIGLYHFMGKDGSRDFGEGNGDLKKKEPAKEKSQKEGGEGNGESLSRI